MIKRTTCGFPIRCPVRFPDRELPPSRTGFVPVTRTNRGTRRRKGRLLRSVFPRRNFETQNKFQYCPGHKSWTAATSGSCGLRGQKSRWRLNCCVHTNRLKNVKEKYFFDRILRIGIDIRLVRKLPKTLLIFPKTLFFDKIGGFVLGFPNRSIICSVFHYPVNPV